MKKMINWKLFRVLVIAGLFGSIAILPLAISLQGDLLNELPIPLPLALVLSIVQGVVLIGIVIFIGLLLSKKVGLEIPIIESWLNKNPVKEKIKSILPISIIFGVSAGISIIGLDYIYSLISEPFPESTYPIWQGFLASFYGGIVEEILLRLFLMTFLVWIIHKFSRSGSEKPTRNHYWAAIIISALIFGIGHLPATSVLTALTPIIVSRALILNGVGGVIFGWLYWKKGLESAIIAHFSADIVLQVVFPIFTG